MAETLLRARTSDDVQVSSAGLLTEDEPADINAVAALAELGYEVPRSHRSRRLTREALSDADLVIGLARQHVRDAVVLDRGVFARAFTLKELVRRAESASTLAGAESLAAWLVALHEGRQVTDLLVEDPSDDIVDPRGKAPDAYRATARELDDLVHRLAAVLDPDAGRGEGGNGSAQPASIETWRGPTTSRDHIATIGLLTDPPTAPFGDELRDALAARGCEPVSAMGPPATDWVACGADAAGAITTGAADIVICTSINAAGTAVAANRHAGVRAVATADTRSAVAAREQLAANVLCVDAALASATVARAVVTVFLGAGEDPDLSRTSALDRLAGVGEPRPPE
jgi:protein-tyrosine phosphatase